MNSKIYGNAPTPCINKGGVRFAGLMNPSQVHVCLAESIWQEGNFRIQKSKAQVSWLGNKSHANLEITFKDQMQGFPGDE